MTRSYSLVVGGVESQDKAKDQSRVHRLSKSTLTSVQVRCDDNLLCGPTFFLERGLDFDNSVY